MLKLLFIPTGNVFILPDEEVLKIKRQDRAGEYRILDAGFQEEQKEPEVIDKKDVSELVLKADKRAEEIENELQQEEEKEQIAKTPRPAVNFAKYDKAALIGWLRKFDIPCNKNENKQSLIDKCIKAGINEQPGLE